MENIKQELKKVIEDVMLPESMAYLDELNEDIEKVANDDEYMDAKNDIESFIMELETILKAIGEDKISQEDAKSIYEKITAMLDEHKENE